jgi:urease accessory protein
MPLRLLRHAVLGLAALPCLALPALAHHPVSGSLPPTIGEALLAGLLHPLLGLDRLAFLMAIGVLGAAARLGPDRLLLFVGASVLGLATAWWGFQLPAVETLTAASALAAGLLLLAGTRPAGVVWLALLILAGLVHGQAYSPDVRDAAPAAVRAYLAGIAAVQAAVMLALFCLVRRWPAVALGRRSRIAGVAMAILGAVLLMQELLG